ncbi:MAG: aminotransferase class I/II-fold pyridoxal phosphate-dependent enzyme [Ilyomonas sp.]
MYNDDFLQKKLNERKAQNAFRQLRLPDDKIDLCSNDYLGIVRNKLLHVSNSLSNGSTGSRLLAGNYFLIEETEKGIAAFHQTEAALIFNSGYDANIGVLSSVAQRGDTILYDALSHASLRDGIRLSFAQSFSFAHNDVNDLERRLQQTTGNVFVVTESVFSMDGDVCPLKDIISLCKQFNAHLIIDEAHATGIIGDKGEGLTQQLQLQNDVFCRIHTFGKACGCHGAVVVGSKSLRDYLINFARSFIYSTSLPEHTVAVIQKSYETFPSMQKERKHLNELIQQFQSAKISYEKLISFTPIQVVIVPGNAAVKVLAKKLQDNDFDIRPVLYPTVPKGKERLRIALHAFNTKEQLELLNTILA